MGASLMMLVLLRIDRVRLVLEGDRWRCYEKQGYCLTGIHVVNEY
jgi:hypothetical protein